MAGHRLATQSASEAFQRLAGSSATATVPSGLAQVDIFQRGKVAEVWGPAGAGKTALACQAAAAAARANGVVTWLDCATLLSPARLQAIDGAREPSEPPPRRPSCHYRSLPTLSHLLALVLHPPATFPPPDTALLVIEDVNKPIDLDYPRLPFHPAPRTEQQRWHAGRRYALLASLANALTKLAAVHNLAVIVTTGCSSRMRTEDGLTAAIGPGIAGAEWENGIWSRALVFRDFNGRFVAVQKRHGRNLSPLDPTGHVRNVIAFEIAEHGTVKERPIEVDLAASAPAVPGAHPVQTAAARVARKRSYDEIADSEGEELDEYGWAEKDDHVLAAEQPGAEPRATATEPAAT